MSAARILPREEWGRLPDEIVAFLGTMNADDASVVVVEEGREIVARMVVMRVPHLESFWMAPDKLGNAGITRALLRGAVTQAREWAPNWIYANADNEETMRTLGRLGGRYMPMHTFLMPLQRLEVEEATCPAL